MYMYIVKFNFKLYKSEEEGTIIRREREIPFSILRYASLQQ